MTLEDEKASRKMEEGRWVVLAEKMASAKIIENMLKTQNSKTQCDLGTNGWMPQ